MNTTFHSSPVRFNFLLEPERLFDVAYIKAPPKSPRDTVALAMFIAGLKCTAVKELPCQLLVLERVAMFGEN